MNKKILLAAAATLACVGAHAQSSVSLYGLLDTSLVSAKGPGAAATTTAVQSGNMTTSYWGMRATEDLGGGVRAQAVLEGFLLATNGAHGRFNGDPMFSRNANVSLTGGMGTVALGRVTNSLFVNNLLFNAFGDSFGFSPAIRMMHLSAGQATGDTGWNESIKWTLPTFQGTTISIHNSPKGSRAGSNMNVAATYFRGPISAGATWQEVRRRDGGGTGANDSNAWQIGGAYDAKVVKLFAQVGKVENVTTKVDYDHMGVGATVPMGPSGRFMLQYNQMEPSNAKASKTTSVGYNHNLSRRTDVYAVYMNEQVPGVSTGNTYGVGMRHRF